jgi:hypothetical protein
MELAFIRRAVLAAVLSLGHGWVLATAFSIVPGSQGIVRGQTTYVDLWVTGLGDDNLWGYSASLNWDPSLLQMTGFDWNPPPHGDQVFCPGPTPATCTQVGGLIHVGNWDFNLGSFWFGETINTEHWNPSLNAIQLNDFSLMRVFFTGLAEGTTWVTASALLWDIGSFGPVTTQIDVQLPEPATGWLALPGLALLLARRRSRAT